MTGLKDREKIRLLTRLMLYSILLGAFGPSAISYIPLEDRGALIMMANCMVVMGVMGYISAFCTMIYLIVKGK